MDEGFNTFSTARAVAQVYDPNYLVVRYFGGFVPWVFTDIALSREAQGNGWSGYRRDATSRCERTRGKSVSTSTAGSSSRFTAAPPAS